VVSVVVPTKNRSALAQARARWALAQPSVREVIFVVDGAEDDTAECLNDLAATDARLRVIDLPRSVGPPAAKNVGVRAATSQWVFVIDDDDIPSDNLIGELLDVARVANADAVGVPWFGLRPGETLEDALKRMPTLPGGPRLDHPGVFPTTDWADCLWIHANALFRRTVFDKVSYDEFYFGSCYREENDLFVSAARAGHRIVVTSRGYTYMGPRTGGGINHKSKLKYEYSVMRNSAHFLRKHGRWLQSKGLIGGTMQQQTALMASRIREYGRRAKFRVVRSAGT
jgi:glycosyltransferase involved in cell wall biosynthesis